MRVSLVRRNLGWRWESGGSHRRYITWPHGQGGRKDGGQVRHGDGGWVKTGGRKGGSEWRKRWQPLCPAMRHRGNETVMRIGIRSGFVLIKGRVIRCNRRRRGERKQRGGLQRRMQILLSAVHSGKGIDFFGFPYFVHLLNNFRIKRTQ